jgi:predicted nucleic acid-binding protein
MPAFLNISDISKKQPENQLYFFDTNVWIYALDVFRTNKKPAEEKYQDFFHDVIADNVNSSRAVICNLLISEVISIYMRRVAVTDFNRNFPGKLKNDFDFKKDYRIMQQKHHDEFFNIIVDNIKSYIKNKHVHLVNDDFVDFCAAGKVEGCSPSLDYADYCYYEMVKKISQNGDKISVVTHDGDWKFADVNIITAESGLLNLVRYI